MKSALLVTSALHMPHAVAAVRAMGVEVFPMATDGGRPTLAWLPGADALSRGTRALHEWVGIVVYRWRV